MRDLYHRFQIGFISFNLTT